MRKRNIIRWWTWGLLVMLPGVVLIPSSLLALAAHSSSLSGGPDLRFVGDSYSTTMVKLVALGGVFALAGLILLVVAWAGALRNTLRLTDSQWFNVLLGTGISGIVTMPLFGIGAIVWLGGMLAYLVAGPDGMSANPRPTTPAKRWIAMWTGLGYAVSGIGLAAALLVANLTYTGRPLHGMLWPSLTLEWTGIAVCWAGGLIVYAAWFGAVFNSYLLVDRAWFRRMLWGGGVATVLMPLLGLGALVLAVFLIAYIRYAPDGLLVTHPPQVTRKPPPTTQAVGTPSSSA